VHSLPFLSVSKKGQEVKIAHLLSCISENIGTWSSSMEQDALTESSYSIVSAVSSSLSSIICFKILIVNPIDGLTDPC
jgi:chemotaxis protein CheY-P-specific phosphatase CheC